jgi:hypothetical protein
MTTVDFQKKLDTVVKDIVGTKLPDFFAMTVNNDLILTVQMRLQEKGELSTGDKPSYSTKHSLIGYPPADDLPGYADMHKKAYEQLKSNKATKWVTYKGHKLMVNEGGYKWQKELIQEHKGIVDFTVSGNMLRSVKVKNTTVSGAKIIVTYGPSGTEEIKKMSALSEKKGKGVSIIMPNAKEIEATRLRVQKQLIRFLNEGLFGS